MYTDEVFFNILIEIAMNGDFHYKSVLHLQLIQSARQRRCVFSKGPPHMNGVDIEGLWNSDFGGIARMGRH